MKVIFGIPTYNGTIESKCMMSLIETFHVLWKKGIEADVFILSNCTYLPVARSTLTAMFMETDATDLFFIDADVGFDSESVMKLLDRSEDLVAGIYPLKRDMLSFPVQIKTKDDIPVGKVLDGKDEFLLEADYLPTGFMRIKRTVIEQMQEAYPELRYEGNFVDVLETTQKGGYDLFNMGVPIDGKTWTTEDYAFCERWRKIGGRLWICPNLNFEHVGKKSFKGNYQDYLPKSKMEK